MGLTRRFSYYGASRGVIAIAQLLLVHVAVGQLGAGGYGAFNLMLQGAMLLRLLVLQGIAQVLVRDNEHLVRAHGEPALYVAALFLMAIALAVVTALVMPLAPQLAGMLNVSSAQVWLSLAMGAALSLFGLKHVLLYNRRFAAYTAWDTVQSLAVIIFPILVGIVVPVADAYATAYVLVTLALALAISQYRRSPSHGFQAASELGAKVSRYGLPLMVGDAMGWIVSVVDRFQIAAMLGIGQAGFYAAAYQLFVAPMTMLGFAIALVLQPAAFESQTDVYQKKMEQAATILVLISALIVVLALMFGPEVFGAFFRRQGDVDRSMVALLVLTGAANSFFQLELIAGKYARNARTIMAAQTVAAVVILIGNWILLPRLGVIAAAGTSLAAYVLQIAIIRWSHDTQSRFSYFNPRTAWSFLTLRALQADTTKKE